MQDIAELIEDQETFSRGLQHSVELLLHNDRLARGLVHLTFVFGDFFALSDWPERE